MKNPKFVFIKVPCFYFSEKIGCQLYIDNESDYYRKAFVLKDDNHFDKENNVPFIFELETGNLIEYLELSSGVIKCDVYYNQLYYSYNFNNPHERLQSFTPTDEEIRKAIAIYNHFIEDEELIKANKLVRFRKIIED